MTTTKSPFKRPFQPSISSYFGHARDNAFFPTPLSSAQGQTLPSTIQSSLLNVGMRVRKSIPEGYKTRPKTSCPSYTPHNTGNAQSDNSSHHSRNASMGISGLTPYCGIFKIGGHAVQPVLPENELPPLQFDHHDWRFPSSQEACMPVDLTTTPISIPHIGNKKRRREDADEEDFDLNSEPISQRSRPISHTRMPNLDQIRSIALPKTRKRLPQTIGLRESAMLDVEDFEEAEFFKPDEWGQDWMQLNEF